MSRNIVQEDTIKRKNSLQSGQPTSAKALYTAKPVAKTRAPAKAKGNSRSTAKPLEDR